MSRRQRLAASFTALLVALGLVVAVQTPAQAAYWECYGNSVQCWWEGYNGSGSVTYSYYQMTVGYCYNVPSEFNDKMSSGLNKTGGLVRYWHDANCSGDSADLENGWRLDDPGWWDDDEMTSFKLLYYT